MQELPLLADVSFAIVLVPDEPWCSAIANASMAVTKRLENKNIIDNDQWPAHVSLVLSGARAEALDRLVAELRSAPWHVPQAPAPAIVGDGRGFISAPLEPEALRPALDEALAVIERAGGGAVALRPHLARRWARLSSDDQTLVRQFGTYKVAGRFKPHLSVAQVAREHEAEALDIVRAVSLPPETGVSFSSIQLVDVGHQNEKWKVLGSHLLR